MALKNLYYLNKTNHHDITEVWLKFVFNTNVILHLYNPTCTQLNVLSKLYFTDYTHI